MVIGDFVSYVSFANFMSSEDARRYQQFLKNGSTSGLTEAEMQGISKVDDALAIQKVNYDEILNLRKSGNVSPNINRGKICEHVFSLKHIEDGIMNLGTNESEIINKFFSIAKATSGQWVEGSNEIRTMINGIKVTIRFYVKNGEIINLDGFVGYSKRIIGKLILY